MSNLRSKEKTNTKVITLVGGGLVGSLLALILARKGYQVDVYESRPDMRKQDISAGRSINLALANRGIKPLENLGLMADINQLMIPMRGRMVHVEGQAAQLQPYGQASHEVIYSISRGQLNSYLMTQAEATGLVNFHFDHKVNDINFTKQQLTVNHNQQEKTVNFDLLFGSDGANSPVRHAILAQSKEQNTLVKSTEEMLDHSYKELTILPDKNGKHQLDKQALHIWPRGEFMLIALANLDGSFTVTLFMPNSGTQSFANINTAQEIEQFFTEHFASVKPLLADLVNSYQQNPTGKLATVKCAPWHIQDKGLILGDAAHAIVPFHGQGMNCGFEDCYWLAEHLPQACDDTEVNWQSLFEQFQFERKPNSDAIADMALENYIEMRDSVRKSEFIKQKQFAFQLQQWFPERFTPRYAMVMFEHRPYQQAYQLGKVHQQLLAELSAQFAMPVQLTKDVAEQLLDKYQL